MVAGAAAGAGAGAGGGLGALGFCCMTTMKDASVTPAAASVTSSVSTLPLCTRTMVSTGWLWASATFALTAATSRAGSSSTSNLVFVLRGRVGGESGRGGSFSRERRAVGGARGGARE